jgi:two-component system sensor histidine kinase ChiS
VKISLFLFIIFLFVTCGVAIPQKSTPGTLPKAEGGIMDLSAYDFVKGDLIKLDGEWEFYWDRLLGPGDFRKTDARAARYGAVPLYWTEYRDAQLPARGGATYRLRIKTSGVREALSIQMPEIFTEFKLWINGRVMDAHGSFTGNAVRFLKPDLCTFLNDSGTIEIILQIRNYAHSNAGIGQSFLLGSPERVSRNRLSSLLLEMILISICIFASIYHIIMFAFRREERDILYFALFTLALALRTMMTGNTFVMQIFPDLPFEIGSRVATAVIPACVITFLMFTYHFFSEPEPRSVMRALLGLHLLYVLLVFVTPTFFYSTVFAYYLIVIIITGLYVWGIAIASMIRGNWYAVIFLIGFAFVFITLVFRFHHRPFSPARHTVFKRAQGRQTNVKKAAVA